MHHTLLYLKTLSHTFQTCMHQKQREYWVTFNSDDGTKCEMPEIVFALQNNIEVFSASPNYHVFTDQIGAVPSSAVVHKKSTPKYATCY